MINRTSVGDSAYRLAGRQIHDKKKKKDASNFHVNLGHIVGKGSS